MSPSECEYIVGFISRKKCGENSVGTCKSCSIPICERHGLRANGDFYCRKCLAKLEAPPRGLAEDVPAYEAIGADVMEDTFWDDLS